MSLHASLSIGEFCRTGSGGTPSRAELSKYYEGGSIPWVKSGELREKVIFSAEEHVTGVALRETSIKMIPKGAILLAMYGATVGRLALLGIEATTNQAVCHIVPDPDVADTRYVFHALSSQVPRIVGLGVGGAQPNISQGVVKNLKVPLPPLPEQRRIAAILDKADALRSQRREALAQLDRLAQAIFVEMFGDPVMNPMGLPRVSLGELLASGPQNGLYKPSSEYGSGALILRIDAFYDGVVTGLSALKRVKVDAQELALYGLREDEIVINRVNSPAYLGKSALIPALPEPVVFESNMMRFALNTEHCLPSYLNSFLQTAYMKAQIRTASKDAVNQSSINQHDVKSFIINLPPLALQHSYSKRLAEVERLRTRFVKATGEGDNLFASLQHRAFRGEL